MATLIDLTHPISAGMTKYPLLPDVRIDPIRTRLQASVLHVGSHVGTHIDAPAHAVEGGVRMEEIPLERFQRTAVVTSVRRGPGEVITLDDVLKGGPEPQPGESLLVHTGYALHFEDFPSYEDHPWFDVEVAHWAVRRGISMLGMDMFSPDQPIDRREDDATFTYPIHRTLLRNDVLIVENLTNLDRISGERGRFYCYPLVTREPGGDAGHARFVFERVG